jgi:SAM-dependent methyltransferase
MTQEMIEKARKNAVRGGYTQVEFRLGDAESMPVENASMDWVISNCVINLSPDKPKVFGEIARVLKPGGRFSISDIVLRDGLPGPIAENMRAWTSCMAGAIRETEYVDGLRKAGLKDVVVESRTVYDRSVIMQFLDSLDWAAGSKATDAIVKKVVGNIWSAELRGRKP